MGTQRTPLQHQLLVEYSNEKRMASCPGRYGDGRQEVAVCTHLWKALGSVHTCELMWKLLICVRLHGVCMCLRLPSLFMPCPWESKRNPGTPPLVQTKKLKWQSRPLRTLGSLPLQGVDWSLHPSTIALFPRGSNLVPLLSLLPF